MSGSCGHSLHQKYLVRDVGEVCTGCDPRWVEWSFDTRWYDVQQELTDRVGNVEPPTPEEQAKMAAEYMRARYFEAWVEQAEQEIQPSVWCSFYHEPPRTLRSRLRLLWLRLRFGRDWWLDDDEDDEETP